MLLNKRINSINNQNRMLMQADKKHYPSMDNLLEVKYLF